MKKKCKIFHGNSYQQIEDQINEWLAENERTKILSINYQFAENCEHNVLVLYEDRPPIPHHIDEKSFD